MTCDANGKDDSVCCVVRLLPILGGGGVHPSCCAGCCINGDISYQLPTHDLAALLLDQINQRQEDALAHRALTPAYVEVVLMRQSCSKTLYSASSVQPAMPACCVVRVWMMCNGIPHEGVR